MQTWMLLKLLHYKNTVLIRKILKQLVEQEVLTAKKKMMTIQELAWVDKEYSAHSNEK